MIHLKMTEQQHSSLKNHLFPGDSLEAVSLASCGRLCHEDREFFYVHEIFHIDHSLCERKADFVSWPTGAADEFLEKATEKGLAIVKFHSHPGYYRKFSHIDDESDTAFFDAVYGWADNEKPHGSVVMLPNGELFGRVIQSDLSFEPISRFNVVGNNLNVYGEGFRNADKEVSIRDIQAFGDGTASLLSNLQVAVIGCSGTGSPTVEQLYRLKVKSLVIVDPDILELKNLNRNYGSTKKEAENKEKKVDSRKRYLDNIGLDVNVKVFDTNLYDSAEALKEVLCSDFIIGCVDKVDAKQLLNHISTFYLIPYIDVGVKLVSDGEGGIDEITGTINYVYPGGSSLLSRNAYSMKMLEADAEQRVNPEYYKERRKEGYMVDVENPSPAVISINSVMASYGVNEFLARIHPFRYSDNSRYDTTVISLTEWDMFHTHEKSEDKYLNKFIGSGNTKPLLGISELNKFNAEFD